jgi:hypothetical protein
MGGDGGTYVTGRQYIRSCKTEIEGSDYSKSVKERQRRKATTCAVSGLPLAEPVVMCQLGNLFNKEAIITALINKTLNSAFSHIRGLKDLKQVLFTPNPAFSSEDLTRDKSIEEKVSSQYICPITNRDFNGEFNFVLIWTTGWLLSEKAVREMGVEHLQAEYGPFGLEDIVTVLPMENQLAASNHMMAVRYAKSGASGKKCSKEEKKRKRAEAAAAAPSSSSSSSGVVAESKEPEDSRCAKVVDAASSSSSVGGGGLGSGSGGVNLKSSGAMVKAAAESIKAQGANNQTYSGLFHKTDNKVAKADDLLMRVAGIRGTLR